MKALFLLLILAILVAGCVQSPPPTLGQNGEPQSQSIENQTGEAISPQEPEDVYPPSIAYPGLRWNHMPLRVFVDTISTPNGYVEHYEGDVLYAMETLEESTGDKISFFITPSRPDITIHWVTSLPTHSEDAVGHNELEYIRGDIGVISSSEISLLTITNGRPMTSEEMRNIALHELGHTLGLNHSSDQTSIMFPTTSRNVQRPNSDESQILIDIYSQEALPDLTITMAQLYKKTVGRTIYLDGNVTIENKGYTKALNATLDTEINGQTIDTFLIDDLDFGVTLTYSFMNLRAGEDFDTVSLEIDPDNTIREMKERNNRLDVGMG